MANTKYRLYSLDGDSLEISFAYDKDLDKYFGNYPDFEETPRYTPNGKPWVNATFDGCIFADQRYGDCGSCEHYITETPGDLIGICANKKLFVARRKEDSK